MATMTYSEAIEFLYDLQWFGFKLGLENTRRLAALAGNPEERLRFIHVAGTNGKGSTCALLESIYRAAGLRVGLFTSPHLVSFSERIQVNRRPIPQADVVRLVSELRGLMARFESPGSPTFFEVVTVMALRYFAEQCCDLVIWETGLGGRLDATNIVRPLASVITNVQLDHQQWLGDTLAKIAAEKAGILKPGVPALTAAAEPEALAVIRETAARIGAPLTEITPLETHASPLDQVHLPLLGEHQRFNAALALAAVRTLATAPDEPGDLPNRQPLRVSEGAIRIGLAGVDWPGRLQTIRTGSGQLTVLDGAHNPAGVAALRAALDQCFPHRRPMLILGVLRDKDWQTMCHALAPLAETIYLVPVASGRTASPAELRQACSAAVHEPIVCSSLEEALELAAGEPFRLITGSLYLVGQALECLGHARRPRADERQLNEWQVGVR